MARQDVGNSLVWARRVKCSPGPGSFRLNTQKLQNAFALRLPEWQGGMARMLTETQEK